jgi:Uma2 family endonuclease
MYTHSMPVVYETESPHATRSDLGPYREVDYLALPEQPRCELLYGRLPVTPAPTFRHQLVVTAIGRFLYDFALPRGEHAVVSPIDVVLAEHSIVQPDVIYVSRERTGIVGRRVEGAPDLVVEILSPATGRRDLGEKLRLYADSGVAEYWIVDPVHQTFEFLANAGDGFRVSPPDGPIFRSRAIPGLELDLEAFWRAIPVP